VSTNPSPVTAPPAHDDPPPRRGSSRGGSRERVPDWAKAAGLASLRSSASRGAGELSHGMRRVQRAVRRTARSARHGLEERGEAVPAIALVIVSVVTWAAIALAVLSR
jgi:hypothetical protein